MKKKAKHKGESQAGKIMSPVSQASLARAYIDGREVAHSDTAMGAAEWCLLHRGKKLSPGTVGLRVIENFRDGDSAFFHGVARAMEELEREGAVVEHGVLVSKLPSNEKVVILGEWARWERLKAKVVVRLAELKEQHGISVSKGRYYAILKDFGLK